MVLADDRQHADSKCGTVTSYVTVKKSVVSHAQLYARRLPKRANRESSHAKFTLKTYDSQKTRLTHDRFLSFRFRV